MERKNISAFTEPNVDYPAFISVNHEPDGTVTISIRERGHDGNKFAQLTGLSFETVREIAKDMLAAAAGVHGG